MDELTTKQRDKLQAWFDEKAALIGKCPMCGHRNWQLVGHMVSPPVYTPGGITLGGIAYPMVMLGCSHCANIQFHSAQMIGLIEPTDDSSQEGAAQNG